MNSLLDIKVCLHGCRECSTRQEAYMPVMGEGNPNADVFIIGRAPGKVEDIEGHPFIGKGGDVLKMILDSIGLNRNVVYITNLVKCYPDRDRANTEEEVRNCYKYLLKELLVVKPKLVIVCGSQANRYFLGLERFTSYVGSIFEHKLGFNCVPIIHPSAILKNKSVHTLRLYNLGIATIKESLFALEAG